MLTKSIFLLFCVKQFFLNPPVGWINVMSFSLVFQEYNVISPKK